MKKHLLSKLLLLSALLGGANSVWAQAVPDPVYFNDFSTNEGVTQHGSGQFNNDADDRFGRFYQNDPNSTNAVRSNYLLLPNDVLSHSASTNEMTIGFWVNKKIENSFFYSPLFSAYGSDTNYQPNTWPMLVCETRGLIQLNCSGYCDFGINDETPGKSYNDGTPYVSTTWLDDGEWHYYTITLTSTKAKVYIDGVLINGWTVDGTSDGQKISGLFSNGSDLKYVCLGGNQAWGWNDPDPSFGFDDFAVYDKELSADQITQIIKNKLRHEYTVDGTEDGYSQKSTIGQSNKSGGFFDNPGNSFVIKKGQTYKLNFKNSGTSSEIYYNWIVKFVHGGTEYFARSDWWAANGANWGALVGTFTDRHKASTDGGETIGGVNWDTFKSVMSDIADVDLTITYTSGGDFKIQGTSANGDNIFYYDYSLEGFTNDITVTLGHEYAYLTNVVVSAVANTGANGITTFSSSYHLNLDDIAGATAYSVLETDASSAKLTTATGTVAAGEGLFLKGEANAEVTIPLSSAGSAISGNMLVGSPVASTIDDLIIDYDNIYVLGATDGKLHNVATYVSSNTLTIPACKAFLRYSGDSNARDLSLIFDDAETTGIQAAEKKMSDNAMYFDLMGRRVAQPQKGLYIVNGKKVVIK